MKQLVSVTTTPFRAIHFSQNARLVPSDNLDIERRKAVARHFAFTSRYSSGGGSVDLDYINRVNNAFSSDSSSAVQQAPISRPAAPAPAARSSVSAVPLPVAASPVSGQVSGAVSGQIPGAVSGQIPGAVSGGIPGAVSGQIPGAVSGGIPGAASGQIPGAVSGRIPGAVSGNGPARPAVFPVAPGVPAAQPLSSEAQAAYTMQRGALELRVAKGDLAFVPPIAMTIITQYPDIHFEYTGGFNYVPPREDSGGSNMNLFI